MQRLDKTPRQLLGEAIRLGCGSSGGGGGAWLQGAAKQQQQQQGGQVQPALAPGPVSAADSAQQQQQAAVDHLTDCFRQALNDTVLRTVQGEQLCCAARSRVRARRVAAGAACTRHATWLC